MSETARERAPAEAAAEAVKAYVRMNREALAADGELLAQLLPDRFAAGEVRDLQRFVIERLSAENTRLKTERDALKDAHHAVVKLDDGVRNAILDLIDARSFSEAIAVAIAVAPAFGADLAAFCVEGDDRAVRTGTVGVRLIPQGTTAAVMGREGMGAILSGGGELLLGPAGAHCGSLAAFRLKIGRDTPAALYVLGAAASGRFEGDATEAGLRYFARALERAIRAWLDLPKI
jgi:uncharacterized protein YigA (DUF484 family)